MKVQKLAKILLVTAEYDPLRRKMKRVLEEVAKETEAEFEERLEDWEFLMKYGERDEFGGFDLPQVFVISDDGSIKHVLTRVPLSDAGKPLFEKVKKLVVQVLKG